MSTVCRVERGKILPRAGAGILNFGVRAEEEEEKEGRPGTDGDWGSGESAWRRRAGLAAAQPKPSMPSRRGYVSFAGPKESNQRKGPGCDHPVSRSRAKSLIKTGRLHPIKSNVPASPNTPSSTNSVRATTQEPPYPFCHALSPVLKGLTAGLRTEFGLKGQCGLASPCLPQRPTLEGATAKSCREKLRG